MVRNRVIKLGAVTAIAAVTVMALACSNGTDASTVAPSGNVGSQPVGSGSGQVVSNSGVLGTEAARSIVPGDFGTGYAYPYQYQNGTFSSGIVVTGIGMQSAAADLGIVQLGVESRAATVSEAREAAARAMTEVRAALKALGIADKDIVTTYFNIYPETTYVEVKDELGTHGQSKIIGYIVSNSVEVSVRDIEKIGAVVDEAAIAGGDLIRVNSIYFTLADPNVAGQTLRELAAKDAKAKAELYAKAMGVTLGPLVYLTETSSSAPVLKDNFYGARAEAAFDGSTPSPVSGGDVDMTTTITAVFAIGQ